jgi:hypothetical protein
MGRAFPLVINHLTNSLALLHATLAVVRWSDPSRTSILNVLAHKFHRLASNRLVERSPITSRNRLILEGTTPKLALVISARRTSSHKFAASRRLSGIVPTKGISARDTEASRIVRIGRKLTLQDIEEALCGAGLDEPSSSMASAAESKRNKKNAVLTRVWFHRV